MYFFELLINKWSCLEHELNAAWWTTEPVTRTGLWVHFGWSRTWTRGQAAEESAVCYNSLQYHTASVPAGVDLVRAGLVLGVVVVFKPWKSFGLFHWRRGPCLKLILMTTNTTFSALWSEQGISSFTALSTALWKWCFQQEEDKEVETCFYKRPVRTQKWQTAVCKWFSAVAALIISSCKYLMRLDRGDWTATWTCRHNIYSLCLLRRQPEPLSSFKRHDLSQTHSFSWINSNTVFKLLTSRAQRKESKSKDPFP